MPPADLEARYRCYLADQHERLSFPGLSRSGRPISLPLERVYVELKAVADVPEAADTFSADERRLLVEDEARGGRGGADLRMTLDSLRAERWRRDDRAGRVRFQRRLIDEAMADPVALYRQAGPSGRRIELLCAGTFGAPTKEWTSGIPLQYQLLRFKDDMLTVETRCREY